MTAGWGATNPEIYISRNIHNPRYYPSRGSNTLREINQRTEDLGVCQDIMRSDHKKALDSDWHVCANYQPLPVVKYKRDTNRTKRLIYDESGNSDGPTYGDYGGPLMCSDQQVGIFAFPIHTHSADDSRGMSLYTVLDRYIMWMDKTINAEMEKENLDVPAPVSESTGVDIWDELSSANRITVQYFTIVSITVLLFIS